MAVDVVVIGAGILGVSVAYHLKNLGLNVHVIEREEEPALHASGKGAGMVRHLYRHPQLTEWTLRSVTNWPKEVRKRNFQQTGSLIVGRAAPVHHQKLFQDVELSNDNGDKIAGVFTCADGLLDPKVLTLSLYQAALRSGAEFSFGERLSEVSFENGIWMSRTANGKTFYSSWVVNAAGAWLNDFLHGVSAPAVCNARPFVRHLFVIAGFPENSLPSGGNGFHWDEVDEWYLRRWNDASRLFSLCDKEPADPGQYTRDPNVELRVQQKLLRIFPDLASQLNVTKSWHCFRTYADDQLPIWGPDENVPGFFWLGAFGGYGISTGFAAAEDAAKFIAGREVALPHDFLPARTKGTTSAKTPRVLHRT